MSFTDLRTIFNNVWDSVNSALRVNVVAGGGGGGPATIADGADVTQGSIADAATTGPGTVNAHVRSTATSAAAAAASLAGTLTVAGTVTANQGTSPWTNQGPQAAGAAITANPQLVAGELAGNVKLLHLTSLGSVVADQGLQGAGGTASWPVQGAAATGTAVTGNPVLLGGTDGTNVRVPGVTSAGSVMIGALTGAGVVADLRLNTTGLDASSNSVPMLIIQANGQDCNGPTWDRHRNNIDVTLLASASRTTTQTSADITTYNLSGISVFLNMTVVGTGSVTVTINGKDPASGVYYNILTGAAVVTNVGNLYRIMPGIPAAANKDVNAYLPRIIQIVVTANNANAATYSVGYTLHNP